MRPLPTEPIAGAPSFVLGLAVIRGLPTPVVSAHVLLSGRAAVAARYVSLRHGARTFALAVDAVLGLRPVNDGDQTLPPLLGPQVNHVVSGLQTLDDDALLVLRAAKLVPDSVWASVDAQAGERHG